MFHYDGFIVSTIDDMRAYAKKTANIPVTLVDGRNAERFTGEEKDPRGLRSGHIPGAINIPSTDFLNMPDNTFKKPEDIEKLLEGHNVNINNPIRTYCGSGMLSSVVYLGCHLVGAERLALYDGSWSEWASYEDTPIATSDVKAAAH